MAYDNKNRSNKVPNAIKGQKITAASDVAPFVKLIVISDADGLPL